MKFGGPTGDPDRDRALDQRLLRLENAMASETPIDPVTGLAARTVQEAIAEIAAALVVIGAL